MNDLMATLAVLRHHFPLENVSLQVTDTGEGIQGTYDYDEESDKHIIKISSRILPSARDEVLCHEYAHALCGSYVGPCPDAVWGVAYAGLFKLIFGEH